MIAQELAGPSGLSDHALRAVLDTAEECYVSVDARGRVLEFNRAATATFGWTRAEALGRPLADLIMPESLREAHRRDIARYVETGAGRFVGRRLELTLVRRDGTELPVETTISAFMAGDQQCFSAFLIDMSGRRAADRDTRRLAAIVASSQDAIISGSIDGTVETWNRGAQLLYGYDAAEMIGSPVSRLRPEGNLEAVSAAQDRLRGGEAISIETTELRKDGSLIDVAVAMSPLRDESGTVVGVSSIVRDISARKRSEAELREAKARFTGAFQSASIGMAIVALDGRFLAVNAALCRLLGRPAAALLKGSFQEHTHPEDLDADLGLLARLVAGEIADYNLDKRYVLPDGGVVWTQLSVSLVREADGEPLHFVSQVQDITGRKTAEAELRRYAEQLARLDAPQTGPAGRAELLTALEACPDAGLALWSADEMPAAQVVAALVGTARAADLVATLDDRTAAVVLRGPQARDAGATVRRLSTVLRELDPGVAWASASAVRRAGESPLELLARAQADLAPAAAGAAGVTRIDRILALAREQLGMDMAFLGEFADGELHVRAVAGDSLSFALAEGSRLPLEETYCERMLNGVIGDVIPDAAREPAVASLEVTRRSKIGAYAGAQVTRADGTHYGTLCALGHEPRAIGAPDSRLLRFLADLVAAEIEEDQRADARHVQHVGLAGMRALLGALEARDFYTGEHSHAVVALARQVGRRLGIVGEALAQVEQVALLHDIGKVGIPDAILQKQGRLDALEWDLMRQHPIVGERIVAGTTGLEHLAPAIRAEHERWDGGGYPDGLAGDAIPLAARIGLACDAYHAMTSDRPYRAALPEPDARAELRRCAGTQFDPAVVEALLGALTTDAQ